MERTIAQQAVPCSPYCTMAEQISTLESVEEPMVEQVDVAKRKLQLVESSGRNRLEARTATHGEVSMV